MKIHKKAQMGFKEIATVVLIVAALIILITVVIKINKGQKKQSYFTQCKTQLSIATQSKPVGFDACPSFILTFEKNSAKKRILSKDRSSVFELYDYSTIRNILISKGIITKNVKIEDNKIPKEIVFYILAKEIKTCFDVFSVDGFRTFTEFSADGNMCHSCSIIVFDEEFKLNNSDDLKMSSFDIFLNVMPIDNLDEDSKTTYIDYIKGYFKYINFTDTPAYQKPIINNQEESSYLSTNNIYNLLHIYKRVDPKNKDAYRDYDKTYVETSHVALINQDFLSDTCMGYLTISPNIITAASPEYNQLLNEAILYLI